MKVKLKTVTPVHIGTGNEYNNFEYILHRGTLHRISLERIISVYGKDGFEKLIKDRETGKTDFVDKIEENKISIYSLPNKYELNNYRRGIRECVKTGNYISYIPGSSIKGAIRTALLWNYVRTHESEFDRLRKSIIRDIKNYYDFKKLNKLKKTISNNFVNDVFSFNPKEKYDAKYDIMRFIHISDFVPESANIIQIKMIDTYSFIYDNLRKKYSNYVEVIGEGTILHGNISLNPQIKRVFNEDKYNRDKLKIIGLNKNDLSDECKAETKLINFINDTMRRFNAWCIKNELSLIERTNNRSDFSPALKYIKRRNNEFLLIRTGFGIGTIYQTLIKFVEEHDENLFRYLRDKFRLGRTNIPIYPKSIEFTDDKQPLGWLEWLI